MKRVYAYARGQIEISCWQALAAASPTFASNGNGSPLYSLSIPL